MSLLDLADYNNVLYISSRQFRYRLMHGPADKAGINNQTRTLLWMESFCTGNLTMSGHHVSVFPHKIETAVINEHYKRFLVDELRASLKNTIASQFNYTAFDYCIATYLCIGIHTKARSLRLAMPRLTTDNWLDLSGKHYLNAYEIALPETLLTPPFVEHTLVEIDKRFDALNAAVAVKASNSLLPSRTHSQIIRS